MRNRVSLADMGYDSDALIPCGLSELGSLVKLRGGGSSRVVDELAKTPCFKRFLMTGKRVA
jgi:hypothetical protein